MTLPTTGQISLNQVITELNLQPGAISLGQSNVRNLAGKSSGQISMSDLWGKSAVPVPVPYGNYISGGPSVISGQPYYGYIQTNIGVVGAMGTAKDLHYLGQYPVVAVISDAGNNMIFKIGGITSQPPMPYNTFRITVGATIYDINTSEIAWIEADGNGIIGIHYASGAPVLSPAGTQYKVEFLNV